MTQPESPTAPAPTVVAVLGLVAASRVTTLGWLAADAAHAPDPRTAIELARQASVQLAGHDELERLAREHGGDLAVAAGPHLEIFRDITERTRPADWWERLVRTAVAGGMLADLAGALVERLPESGWAGTAVPGSEDHLELVVALTTRVTTGHPSLAARLALWGRRVAGEVLGAVQPALARLDADGGAGLGSLGADLVGELSTTHARRMERLGLAA